jgi:hypothetical protein
MKQYKVTLNFSFVPQTFDEGYEEGVELKKKKKAGPTRRTKPDFFFFAILLGPGF